MTAKEIQNIYRRPRGAYREPETSHAHDLYAIDPCSSLADDERCKRTCMSDGANDDDRALEHEIANILSSKRAVINSAKRQIKRLLDETDTILNDNLGGSDRQCSAWCAAARVVVRVLQEYNSRCVLLLAALLATLLVGAVLGAASCGTRVRSFSSPALTCLNAMFAGRVDNCAAESAYRSVA